LKKNYKVMNQYPVNVGVVGIIPCLYSLRYLLILVYILVKKIKSNLSNARPLE